MKNKIIHMLITVVLISSFLLSGCTRNSTDVVTESLETIIEETSIPVETTESNTTETTIPETVIETEAPINEIKAITITILNLSEIKIGMFAVIDPVTGEQINLGGLAPTETISIECNWPKDIMEFKWALYNQNGELCIDASTNISTANQSVTLVLTGQDTIENVEVVFD